MGNDITTPAPLPLLGGCWTQRTKHFLRWQNMGGREDREHGGKSLGAMSYDYPHGKSIELH